MIYISKEDKDCMDMCSRNHHLSGTTQTAGYLLLGDEAKKYAAYKEREKLRADVGGFLFCLLMAFGILATTLVAIF